jgi:hypothetical protein
MFDHLRQVKVWGYLHVAHPKLGLVGATAGTNEPAKESKTVEESLTFHEIKQLAHPEIEDELLAVLYTLHLRGLDDDELLQALADPEAARSRCEQAGPLWLSAIEPVGEPWIGRLSKHSEVDAWHANVAFEPLGLDAVRKKNLSRYDTYGWKPQLASDHPKLYRSVGEVEIAWRLRHAGYKAYWVDLRGGAPPIWRGSWTCGLYDLPVWLQQLCSSMGRSGWPDVVAWKEDTREVRFVEYKGFGDSINLNQDTWFRTSLESGAIDHNSYLVAGWKPDQAQMSMLAEQKAWQA